MRVQSEIDEVLDRLGSVEPPAGLENRVKLLLQKPGWRFPNARFIGGISVTHGAAGCAVAASLAFGAVALHHMSFHQASRQSTQAVRAPRVLTPAAGGFGTASEIHVPAQPVPVQPTPVNQGRGRSRTGRSTLPAGNQAPLPRGVAPALPGAHPTAPPQ